jgi:hypothetical protein
MRASALLGAGIEPDVYHTPDLVLDRLRRVTRAHTEVVDDCTCN